MLTEKNICLPLGCLQGGQLCPRAWPRQTTDLGQATPHATISNAAFGASISRSTQGSWGTNLVYLGVRSPLHVWTYVPLYWT